MAMIVSGKLEPRLNGQVNVNANNLVSLHFMIIKTFEVLILDSFVLLHQDITHCLYMLVAFM